MKNIDVRNYAKSKLVRHWEIAEKLGIGENVFCVKLRKELSPEAKSKIIAVIDEIVKERGC